ncbi:bifunctional ornithine acetyltransferase/N-acetylglutamate synthase [Sphingorhabdus lutea]|uniref:Arginine biosynthesis bifunctional protein ArgJ n=1 Tax=Sphingorhabdus lutea TaxID=1913578 RepID=A0A1L3JCA5_9SPHN|nr:bifunctional glutamate N-acetyltransferase/amino-acid acetyltransferase ArgJ [Sphingorhabdus lutea]APG62761.1 bifunctional ornithine acetyltransferase/N-acetylglutamate synthase [Sphingorhabdus lutea]
MSQISPLAPATYPDVPIIDGVEIFTVNAGYKTKSRNDLTFITFAKDTMVAGVTTKNICCSHEVVICREHLKSGMARALIVNSGNSNAFTGKDGKEAADMMVQMAAAHLDCPKNQIFISSTGVIGVPLPKDIAETGLKKAFTAEHSDYIQAANAISTTDTFPKLAMSSAMIGGKKIHLSAIIKGSGMIAPDMATMLGYIFTDAKISSDLLQDMMSKANANSFSCITVDSDTSTSDTVLAFATGAAKNDVMTSYDSIGADAFFAALQDICLQMAHLVVKDGEGASKFIRIDIIGANDDKGAHNIGLAIANSPLVKTAIAGEDANWGRVVMAVGKAGEIADRDKLSISFGGIQVAANGHAVDGYDEAPVAQHLKGQNIDILVDIGIGEGKATIWTCDLTHGYISINADYRS